MTDAGKTEVGAQMADASTNDVVDAVAADAPSTPDASSTPDAGPVTAFTGAPAYVSQTGAATNDPGHNGSFANNDPIGQNCASSSCHAGAFIVSGSVYVNSSGTAPAGAGVEVRIRAANGAALTTYTDTFGNFFIPYSAPGIFPIAGSLVGVRDATNMRMQASPVTDGSCASGSCHSAMQTPGRIFL
jgi:hypothetical protein